MVSYVMRVGRRIRFKTALGKSANEFILDVLSQKQDSILLLFVSIYLAHQ